MLQLNQLYNMDCMEGMAQIPDKYFELAIVDPPYGINISQELHKRGKSCKKNGYREYANKDWDGEYQIKHIFKSYLELVKTKLYGVVTIF